VSILAVGQTIVLIHVVRFFPVPSLRVEVGTHLIFLEFLVDLVLDQLLVSVPVDWVHVVLTVLASSLPSIKIAFPIFLSLVCLNAVLDILL